MFEDTTDSAVAGASTTPAPAESAETTASVDTPEGDTAVTADPLAASDPWATIDLEAGEDEDKPIETAEAGDEPAAAEGDAEPEKAEPEEEQSEEEKAIDALFSEEKPEDDKKSGEPTQEELEAMPPEELVERQKNNYAKAWARRNAEKAEVVKAFSFDTTPIAEVADKLKEISPERYAELTQHAAHSLVDANPEDTFRRAYAVRKRALDPKWDVATAAIPTLDEIIAGDGAQPAAQPATSQPVPDDVRTLTAELDAELHWDWRDPDLDDNFVDEREKAMAKSLRALEAAANTRAAEAAELQAKVAELANAQPPDDSTAVLEGKLQETIQEYRQGVAEILVPRISKQVGLEIAPDDPPEIVEFKQSRLELYTGTPYERANNQDSAFETFAYNESSVKGELSAAVERLVATQLKEAQARLAGDEVGAERHRRAALEERVPLIALFVEANKEFRTRIDRDMALLGKAARKLAAPLQEASERVEVVSTGAGIGSSTPKRPDYATAEDVWEGTVREAAQEDALRAGA
jgi:hypothetical protein